MWSYLNVVILQVINNSVIGLIELKSIFAVNNQINFCGGSLKIECF